MTGVQTCALPIFWNSTTPTSTIVTFGAGFASVANYVAYCFADVAGYSAFGSYSSNASSDGPFVFTGFRPRWVMIKKASGTTNTNTGWYIYDTARSTYNVIGAYLLANSSSAENSFSAIDILSNGFKIRDTDSDKNTSASTYIFAAFAETPFKYALAR